MSDKRFARVANDPRFKKVDRKRRKVKIDSRFERMFNDKTFTTKHFVDKRGAIIGKTSKEDLRQFYDLSDDDKEESQTNELGDSKKKLKSKTKKDGTELGKKTKKKREQVSSLKTSLEEEEDIENTENISNNDFQNQRTMESSDEDEETSDDSDDERGNKMTVDLARGEGNLESSSSDDDDEDDEDDIHKPGSSNYKQESLQENGGSYDTDTDDEDDFQDDELDHQWAELDHNIHRSSDVTCRLAVCNLDWDKITATDLFVLFSSIKGVVKSVKIYPSEFGLERLKNEECYGPEELREQEENLDDNNVEGSSFSREKLRQYQINRLKYYYAVVECDSEGTSNNVYEEFDGVEYELSGNLIDLRFIPDDMEFQHEPISVATEMPTLATYKPPEFETTALHQTNVKLTWDETDSNRLKTTMKAFSKGDLQDMDFQAYLASSDDEGEEPSYLVGDDAEDSHSEDEEEKIAKYKKLVQEIDSKEHEDDNDNEMEITWEPGLKESALDLVAKKRVEKEEKNLTAWDKYLNKKKEKRKERRKKEKEMKLQKNEVSQEDDEDDIPEGVDMSDPFFSQGFGPDFPDNNNERVKTKSVAKKKGKKQETEEDKKRKEELELLLMDGKEEPHHFSLKGILENEKKKKKRKKKRNEEQQTAEDHFKVNVEDPRFTALFSSHLYAIDPSDPQFKKTKAMDAIFDERQRRREKTKQVTEELTQNTKPSKRSEGEKSTIDPSLSLLVKSVKSKTGEFNQRKKKQKTAK